MTTFAGPVTKDQAVFRFTVPLSGEEFLEVFGLGPIAAARHPPRHHRGWALVDVHGRVWGWHPLDVDDRNWCNASAALAAFIIEPRVRAHLVSDGFHVVADDGALLHLLLDSQPWSGLPPLPSGTTDRPDEPILPHWGKLLDAALAAVAGHGGAPAQGVTVEDLVRAQRHVFRRPAVFDTAVMRQWLASDDAHAALTAMRAAAGWAKGPFNYAEAIALLDPLGCTAQPGTQHTVVAHLSDGDWSIGTCGVCWHPMLVHERFDGQPTMWALFGDLR